MATIDYLFDGILQLSLLAFVMLGISVLIVRQLGQPLERIRLIQITLACLLLAAVFSKVNWTPTISLPILHVASDAIIESGGSTTEAIPQLATIATAELDNLPTRSVANTNASQTPSPSQATASISWPNLAKASFVIGFLALSVGNLLYLLVGLALTRHLVRSAKPLSQAVQSRAIAYLEQYADRNVSFAQSSRVSVPMVSGLFQPTILLPVGLADRDADATVLKHGIAHEWKHVDRNDLLTWHLVSFAQVLLWIQPFYWLLRRELRLSQDQIADQFAADQNNDRATYAETLVGFTKSKQLVMFGALTMAGTKSNLYRRVELLLNEKFQISRISRKRVLFACAAMLTAGGMLLASIELTQAAPLMDPPVEESEDTEKQDGDKEPNEKVVPTKAEGESVSHSGHVVDAISGEPVEGATVVVTRMLSGRYNVIGRTESVTDADGAYTFEIPPDQLEKKALYILFDLRHPTYVDRHCGSYSYSMISKNLKLGSQPWFTKLKMVPGVELSGRLVSESGEPVPGAQLRMKTSDPSAGDRVSSTIDGISGDDGRFSFAVSKSGTAALSIIPRDHCMKHVELAGKRGDVGDIKLTSGISIRGRVDRCQR